MKRRLFLTSMGSVAALSACGGSESFLVQGTGPSSSTKPYLTPIQSGLQFASILTTGDAVGSYRMVGIPDGLGAYDNGNGTFTVLMAHELGSSVGIARAHGGKGAFVSEWVVGKNTLAVATGADLMKTVYSYVGSTWTETAAVSFNRFCSADLPVSGAFYNSASGKGSQARIFMVGEEAGSPTVACKGLGIVATGSDKGKAYVLPWATAVNLGWENLLAHPSSGDKTIVMGNSDGGFNGVYLYVGAKSSTGNEIEKAGLLGGTMYRVLVNNTLTETTAADAGLGLVKDSAAFTLTTDLTTSNGGTYFLRPEDGVWDVTNPSRYYFVTTSGVDTAKDANPLVTTVNVGRTRLWRLTFTDITSPEKGGKIEMMLDGTETLTVNGRVHGTQMFDNMTMSSNGDIILQEDVGNNSHNGKIWKYAPSTDTLSLLAQHDEALFGDYYTSKTGTVTADEESSGVIEVTNLLGRNDGRTYFLMVDQVHAAATGTNATELVEGGQLLLMSY
jgi:hypothetical protein